MCKCMCLYVCVWGPKADIRGLPLLLSTLFTVIRSLLNPELAVVADLASKLPGLGSPCLCLPSRGITGRQPYSLNIFVGSGNQNSGSHHLCGKQGFT